MRHLSDDPSGTSTSCVLRRQTENYEPEEAFVSVGYCLMYPEAPKTMLLTLDCGDKTLSEASLTPVQAERLYGLIGEWLRRRATK